MKTNCFSFLRQFHVLVFKIVTFKVSRRSFLGISNNKQQVADRFISKYRTCSRAEGFCSPNNGESLSANSEGGHLALFERGKRYWQNWVCFSKIVCKIVTKSKVCPLQQPHRELSRPYFFQICEEKCAVYKTVPAFFK